MEEIVVKTFLRDYEWSGTTCSTYPGGEPLIKFDYDQRFDPSESLRVMLRPKTFTSFMAGLFLVDALRERGSKTIHLSLPYVPGARQDRLNDSGDFLFTAKSVAKEINARNFDSVTIGDPHSNVITALIDRVRVITATDIMRYVGLGTVRINSSVYDYILCPDAGAASRASEYAKWAGRPVLHGGKVRDVTTGNLSGFTLEKRSRSAGHKHCLVVDDICDGGGTFIGLAEKIAEQKMTADLFVTHGIFSKGTKDLRLKFLNVYCSDSMFRTRPGVKVIPFFWNDFLNFNVY